MYDVIIIGAGPAGLSAALYAGRSRLKTLIIEKMAVGGRIMMSENIENYPGCPAIQTQELIRRMEEQARLVGAEIIFDEVVELDCKEKTTRITEKTYNAKAIIVASGAHPRKLGVPGEDKLIGRGVSYCATCDGPLYKDKNVVVVGGGNAVAEEALYLARFAKEVTIIHRRNDLRASVILQEKLRANKKIRFVLSHIVTGIIGSNKLESLKIEEVNSKKESNFSCDGVFIYIGYEPDTLFLKNRLKLDDPGFIITDENMATSCEGVFACGDCRKKSLYQVITACGDGATAAESAYKYLMSKDK